MSLVLGIANTSHDSSAAVFRNGHLVAAISEERLSRIKCDGGNIPQRAIDAVLAQAGASRRDVTHIGLVYAYFPEEYFVRPSIAKELERKLSRLRCRLLGRNTKERMLWVNHILKQSKRLGIHTESLFRRKLFLNDEGFHPNAVIRFFDHHDIHAALAAYYSGFSRCSVVTMDGEGDMEECHTSQVFASGKLARHHITTGVSMSAGHFYMAITQLLGFRPLRHEGKVLGLAAHGDPTPLMADFRKALRLSTDGCHLESDFPGDDERYEYIRSRIQNHSREVIAAAAQQTLEDTVVPLVRNFLEESGERNLALNGGVFANVKLNQRLAALPEVDSVFVFPGMSDTGNSVGAALLALEEHSPGFLGRNVRLNDVYWGPEYSDAEIEAALKSANLSYQHLEFSALVENAAQAMHRGRVVGWFQGRMEFGPRALGNRSMVGAPTDAAINKTLNDRLERTEFMPFAPSVLAERAEEIFVNVPKCVHTAEFMTITCDVKPEWHDRIPAVVHVDGTARPQLVRADRNPRYHALISRYAQLSGIPLVLNTSFNVHEEPIVCAPEEGIRALAEDRIDDLAIGNFWVSGRPSSCA